MSYKLMNMLACILYLYISSFTAYTSLSLNPPKFISSGCKHSMATNMMTIIASKSTTAYLCGDPANVSSLKPYGQGQVCCNYTLHSKYVQGSETDCCGNKLFYRDMCTCNTNGQLESKYSGCPLGQCLVTASNSSQGDNTEISSASSKFCEHTSTCFDPSRKVCCQDGVYNGRNVCPSLETNSKFCTDIERLDISNICAQKFNHVYHISFEEMIAQDYRLYNATVSESVMSDKTPLLPKERSVKLKIDAIGRCNYTLTGTTFTVFSAQKYNWNADPYFYLDKDDFVLRKNISNELLIRVIKDCEKSPQKYGTNNGIESVSNSGDKQFCRTHSSVTLEFIFCIGVYFFIR